MDFDDTPEEAVFRAEARAWLEGHARLKEPDGSDRLMMQRTDPKHVERCRAWQRTLYDGGWAGVAWPKAYGGRGASPIESLIFAQEQANYDVSTGVFAVAIGMVGPTLIGHGSDEQKQRYLEPMLRGDEIWCQLFSEPGAGSDLAGLATRAVKDGDEWVVNGQKVWTTGAQHSDVAILLARTNAEAPKHEGITYFLLDMRTPGIDVRPLRQINGVAHFNEVFLDDVRLPPDAVVGDVHKGWTVARTTLTSERALIGGGFSAGFASLRGLGARMGASRDPVTRQRMAEAFIRTELQRYLGLRMQTALSQGHPLGPEAAVMKLAISQHVSATADVTLAMEAALGMLSGDDAPDAGAWQQAFLTQWSIKIGGGTDQIQRNVIGERVLGLPREPRIAP
jgi:alkylation response protein AidB-like acyl-CoA dehydrogenase